MVNFCLSGGIGWVRCGLNFIVPAKMACELLEGCHVFGAKRAFEISCFLTLIGILQEKDNVSLTLNVFTKYRAYSMILTCLSARDSSSRCLEKDESILGGGDILSSLDGGVVGSTCVEWVGTEVKPLARNCWWSKLGRNGLDGITCMILVMLLVLPHTV